jgi:hypothetical protein
MNFGIVGNWPIGHPLDTPMVVLQFASDDDMTLFQNSYCYKSSSCFLFIRRKVTKSKNCLLFEFPAFFVSLQRLHNEVSVKIGPHSSDLSTVVIELTYPHICILKK